MAPSKAALIIVSTLYNARELWGAMKVLKNNDINVQVISLKPDCIIQDEEGPQTMKVHGTIQDFDLGDVPNFDALLIISGALKQTQAHWNNNKVKAIVEEFDKHEKIVSAICCSVPSIRWVCDGKKVAFFPLNRSMELMKSAGAEYTAMSVTWDDRIVTAEHQVATKQWAQTIAEKVHGKEVSYKQQFAFDVDAAIFKMKARKKRERRQRGEV